VRPLTALTVADICAKCSAQDRGGMTATNDPDNPDDERQATEPKPGWAAPPGWVRPYGWGAMAAGYGGASPSPYAPGVSARWRFWIARNPVLAVVLAVLIGLGTGVGAFGAAMHVADHGEQSSVDGGGDQGRPTGHSGDLGSDGSR
jgi:hypothetical protein